MSLLEALILAWSVCAILGMAGLIVSDRLELGAWPDGDMLLTSCVLALLTGPVAAAWGGVAALRDWQRCRRWARRHG